MRHFREHDEHGVVGVREAAVGLEALFEAAAQQLLHLVERPPGGVLALVQRSLRRLHVASYQARVDASTQAVYSRGDTSTQSRFSNATLNVALVVFGALTAAFMLGGGVGKVTGQPAMRERQHFAIQWERYRFLGVVEIAAAVGVVAGLWLNALGLAAGVGVTALMVGATLFHVRFDDPAKRSVAALVAPAASAAYVAFQAAAIWG